MKSSYLALLSSLLLLFMVTFSLIIPVAKPKLGTAQLSTDSPNLGIVSIAASKNVVGLGRRLSLGINVTNSWNETETFNATFYANSTIIQEISNVTVEAQNSTTVTFKWTTTGFSYGNYSISAFITAIPNETDLSDNFIDNLWIFVTITGDINADRRVDIYDAVLFVGPWIYPVHPAIYPWHDPLQAIKDFDDDGHVTIYDAILLAMNFGKHWE